MLYSFHEKGTGALSTTVLMIGKGNWSYTAHVSGEGDWCSTVFRGRAIGLYYF